MPNTTSTANPDISTPFFPYKTNGTPNSILMVLILPPSKGRTQTHAAGHAAAVHGGGDGHAGAVEPARTRLRVLRRSIQYDDSDKAGPVHPCFRS